MQSFQPDAGNVADFVPRALHLHTLDSLLSDLVSGRAIAVGHDQLFAFADERTRSALQWYRSRGEANWPANVAKNHCEQLVDAALADPPQVPPPSARPRNANTRRLK